MTKKVKSYEVVKKNTSTYTLIKKKKNYFTKIKPVIIINERSGPTEPNPVFLIH